MKIIIFFILFFIITEYIIRILSNEKINNENIINNYVVNSTPMTNTELYFFKILQKITNKYNLIILPQIQLQKIFSTYNNDIKAFNKIKAKSIDFAIVDKNYKYKLFIELDDYTHNRRNRIKRDIFVNNLFKKYNLKLIRFKVSNNYNIEEIEKIIQENL